MGCWERFFTFCLHFAKNSVWQVHKYGLLSIFNTTGPYVQASSQQAPQCTVSAYAAGEQRETWIWI